MPARDLQSVIVCGCAFGIGCVGHPLDDEAASLATRRNGIEHVDGVGKRGRGGSEGNQPVARGDGIHDEPRTGQVESYVGSIESRHQISSTVAGRLANEGRGVRGGRAGRR